MFDEIRPCICTCTCTSTHAQEFDKIWPYLRVMARSSPDDKLTLANGLNKSLLFADKERVEQLKAEGIYVYPDRQVVDIRVHIYTYIYVSTYRQVVAMTGDGTNDVHVHIYTSTLTGRWWR